MLLIYTHKSSERVRYTFDLIIKTLLGLDFEITEDKNRFQNHDGPRFNYSNTLFDNELYFWSAPLLFSRGIHPQEIEVKDFDGVPGFFSAPENSALPFDPFAASFYLVTRYEEYLPFRSDEYGRFQAGESLAGKHGFLHRPVVNIWAEKVKEIISQKFPGIVFPIRKFVFTPTYDIDMAWAYQHKGLVRTIGGFGRSAGNLKFMEMYQRLAVLMRLRQDPFYTYETLRDLQVKYNLHPVYFFSVGDFDLYDKNVAFDEPRYRTLVKEIADYADVGLHPSAASFLKKKKLRMERDRLEDMIKRKVGKSRQHFLLIRFPQTFENLIEQDFTDDFSLCYSEKLGFRAGICNSFYFYNLRQEQKTTLRLHPFPIMDATLKFYLKLTPEAALEEVKAIIDEVRSVKGELVTLWHNSSISDMNEWKGWNEVYGDILAYALQGKELVK